MNIIAHWQLRQFLYCECTDCYGRYLFQEKSWRLIICPSPFPLFYGWSCRAGWYFRVGWFRFFFARGK